MGLLMSALGGAAEVGMSQMQDQRKADLQAERDIAQEESSKRMAEYNSELATRRSETLAKVQEALRIETQQRLEAEGQAAEKGGREIRAKREIDTATKRAPSVNRETMGMIKSSLSDAEIEKHYGVKAPTAVSEFDDQIASARQSGNLDTADALRKGRKDAFDEAKEESKDDREERKLTQKEADDKERNRISDKRADAAITAASRSGQPKPAKEGDLTAVDKAELSLLAGNLKDARSTLSKPMGATKKAAAQVAVDEAKKAYDDKLSEFGGGSTKKADQSPKDVGKSTGAVKRLKFNPATGKIE